MPELTVEAASLIVSVETRKKIVPTKKWMTKFKDTERLLSRDLVYKMVRCVIIDNLELIHVIQREQNRYLGFDSKDNKFQREILNEKTKFCDPNMGSKSDANGNAR